MKVIFQGRRIVVPDPPAPVGPVAPAIVTARITASDKAPADESLLIVDLMRLLVGAVEDGRLTATDARAELSEALDGRG